MAESPGTETPLAQSAAPGLPYDPPPNMVRVPAGPFLFTRRKQEVSLGEFWIDMHPVTNGDYEAFVIEHKQRAPRHWPPGGLTDELRDQPVVRLTCAEAEKYAELNGKALPTPAQYEKAARGTEGDKYPWGNEIRGRASNTKESGIGKLSAVDAFPSGASPYGCLDMAGNVLHWTRGVHDPERGTRVVMGSSFKHYLGATYWVYEEEPEKRREYLGFRCVWMPPKAI